MGFVDRNGKFYACHYRGHAALAEKLTGSIHGERELEQKGWLMLKGDPPIDKWEWFYLARYPSNLSKKQWDFVFDWCRKKGKQFPPECYIGYLWEDK